MSSPRPVAVGVLLVDSAGPRDAWDDIPAAARYAESAGLDSIWAGDHLSLGPAPVLDCTLVLAAAAAATTNIAIGSAVFVPSLRPLAWAAKQVATLTTLAGPGRFQLGVAAGAGVAVDHYAAGQPSAGRGRRTDEFLRALPGLLAGQPVDVPGHATQIQLAPAVPKPTIWVGGSGAPALRRTAEHADGWLAALITAAELRDGASRLSDLAESHGRPAPRIGLVAHIAFGDGRSNNAREQAIATLKTAYRMDDERAGSLAIAGSPEQVAEQLQPYLEAGVEHLVVVGDVGPWSATCDQLVAVKQLVSRG